MFAAFIVGVLPALQATGRQLETTLRQLSGGTELRMGGTWTALIVVQVAIAVAVLPAVVAIASKSLWRVVPVATFPADQLLALRLGRVEEDVRRPDLEAAFPVRQIELLRRVAAEPGVAGVTFTVPEAEDRVSIDTDVQAHAP